MPKYAAHGRIGIHVRHIMPHLFVCELQQENVYRLENSNICRRGLH